MVYNVEKSSTSCAEGLKLRERMKSSESNRCAKILSRRGEEAAPGAVMAEEEEEDGEMGR
jgi:hypothetical protein